MCGYLVEMVGMLIDQDDELLFVVNGVLKACARPSSTAERSCSLCRAASALLSAEKDRALSIATAVSEAVALIEASSSEWPQITSEPMGRVPERRTRREVAVTESSSLRSVK